MRHKIALAGAMGGLIALANVLVTAMMMFLSSHDLTLLIVLLVFSLIVSLLFAFILAGSVSASLELLSTGAKRLGQGDLSARINVASQDEIADLANVLNSMAQDLNTASRLKQELEQARKDLVASVSHEPWWRLWKTAWYRIRTQLSGTSAPSGAKLSIFPL